MCIKDIRESAGMTRKEFCECVGIPYRTLQNWEVGERQPPEWVINLIKFYVEHMEK